MINLVEELFNPDGFKQKNTFPFKLHKGIFNYGFSYIVNSLIANEKSLQSLICSVKNHFDHRNDKSFINQIALGSNLEQELVLLTYTVPQNSLEIYANTIQDLLGNIRQERAYNACQRKYDFEGNPRSQPSYHDLAFLYYTLMHGQSSLGHFTNATTYVEPLQKLKQNNVVNPRVLLLGFSSLYSLENLAAILYNVGFKQSTIMAFDKEKQPLYEANKYYGTKLFNSNIEYYQGNVFDVAFKSKFDFIATHLFFTHISEKQKLEVWMKVNSMLGDGGTFADEELFVPLDIDRNYPSKEQAIKYNVSNLMYEFASQGPFNPYSHKSQILSHANSVGLQLRMPLLQYKNMYGSDNQIITAVMHSIIADKQC